MGTCPSIPGVFWLLRLSWVWGLVTWAKVASRTGLFLIPKRNSVCLPCRRAGAVLERRIRAAPPARPTGDVLLLITAAAMEVNRGKSALDEAEMESSTGALCKQLMNYKCLSARELRSPRDRLRTAAGRSRDAEPAVIVRVL